MDFEEVAVLVTAGQQLDRNAAADQVVVKPIKLADAIADLGLQPGRGRRVVKCDLDGDIHRAPPDQ